MSFGTIVQPNILLTKHAKLGLTQRSGDQRREGIGKPRSRGFEPCSQSYSQLVTRSLPSIKLLLVDSSDHPPPPLDRWVAEEGVIREGRVCNREGAVSLQITRGYELKKHLETNFEMSKTEDT